MKKTLLIIAALLALALLSCSNSNHSSGTTMVTIKIGSAKTASVSVQRETLFAKLKHFLADRLNVRRAEAQVLVAGLPPTFLASIQVTVWASDMPTITQTVSVSGTSTVTIVLVVPSGPNRLFAVTGFDNLGTIMFAGGMPADLTGADVVLPIPMNFLGAVTNILYVSTTGNDTTGDGSLQKPFRTITHALTIFLNGSVGILVWPGTYDDNVNNLTPETFPLLLTPASALAGLGQSHAVVLRSQSTGISGAAGAYIDSLRIFVCDFTGIDDLGFITHINNVLLDSTLSCGGGAGDGIVLAADSTVSNTTIKDPFTSGITINSGNPDIKNNTIIVTGTLSVFPFYGILVNAGSPAIDSNVITGFSSASSYGILVSNGTPTITRNSVHGNDTGISAGSSTANPLINNNSIYCNTTSDLFSASVTTINATNNSWDHSPPTTGSPSTSPCAAGTDICFAGPAPLYSPYGATVAAPCP